MNLAEKFRFLADRAEDGQPFYFGEQEVPKVFINGKLHSHNANGDLYGLGLKLKTIQENELSLKCQTPIYYAKIKGWELMNTIFEDCYWHSNTDSDYPDLFVSKKTECWKSKNKFTKSEWNKLGINDINADFEKVEE